MMLRSILTRLAIAACAVVVLGATVAQAGGVVREVRLWTAPDNTRLVFDLNRSIDYRVFRLHSPERVVLDMSGTELEADLGKLELPDPVVDAIRHGKPQPDVLRVVIDVKENVQPRSFLLKPMQGKPYRLVVDLMRPEAEQKTAVRAEDMQVSKGLIIAVDAGHGGEDPGAIGPRGLQEKTVTLAVARKLATMINRQPGMKAVLIRDGDYFVPLGRRVKLARQAKADMMISIHADSVRSRSVEGASVYTLSERGATPDKAAAALAAKENAADEVGGVSMDQVEDPMVNQILGDMFRRDSLNSSQILAETILKNIRGASRLKYDDPKRARFVVLGALEIPSVLVELDYISNPSRERKLRDSSHQQELATALFHASQSFFEQMGRLKSSQASAGRVRTSRLDDRLVVQSDPRS